MFFYLVVFPLLIFASLHASVVAVRLSNAPELAGGVFAPLFLFAGILIVTYGVLKVLRFKGSLPLLSSALAICGIGIIVQYRIGPLAQITMTTPSQAAFPLGVAAMLAVYWLWRGGRLVNLEALWPVFLGLSCLVILFVITVGRVFRGAVFLPGNINPVEIIKPLLVLFAAGLLAGHRENLSKGFFGIPLPPINILVTIALFWCVPMALLMVQGDMGMIALMCFTLVAMFYAATRRSAYLFIGLAAFVASAAFFIPMSSRGRARLTAWLDPFSDVTDTGWQPLQALVALYTGGAFGAGLGAGSPNVVPIVESDFAYIIIGEELGIVGCLCVGLLFIVMIMSAVRVAEKSDDDYSGTVAAGLAACLGFQTLLNIGGVVKAIPLTGITLPLISHGGSSLFTTFLMLGILLAVSDEHAEEFVFARAHASRRKIDAPPPQTEPPPPDPVRKPRKPRKPRDPSKPRAPRKPRKPTQTISKD